jgi:hypothetical protein
MAGINEQKDTERDNQETGANPDLLLPYDEGCQQREGKHHHQHCQQVTDGKGPKRRNESARASFHQSSRNGERPTHPGVHAVIEAAHYDGQPELGGRPIPSAQVQTDG